MEEGRKPEHLLNHCLYFTSARLGRVLNQWAEEAFAPWDLAPSMAFAVLVVNGRPGMNQQELSGILHLAPSTLTRFLERLEDRGLLERRRQGRVVFLHPTPAGLALHQELSQGWTSIYHRYGKILGDEGSRVAGILAQTAEKLEQN